MKSRRQGISEQETDLHELGYKNILEYLKKYLGISEKISGNIWDETYWFAWTWIRKLLSEYVACLESFHLYVFPAISFDQHAKQKHSLSFGPCISRVFSFQWHPPKCMNVYMQTSLYLCRISSFEWHPCPVLGRLASHSPCLGATEGYLVSSQLSWTGSSFCAVCITMYLCETLVPPSGHDW